MKITQAPVSEIFKMKEADRWDCFLVQPLREGEEDFGEGPKPATFANIWAFDTAALEAARDVDELDEEQVSALSEAVDKFQNQSFTNKVLHSTFSGQIGANVAVKFVRKTGKSGRGYWDVAPVAKEDLEAMSRYFEVVGEE